MDFLKHAKRLPVLDWNLTFFGAHEQKSWSRVGCTNREALCL